jgi:hypothetical protein
MLFRSVAFAVTLATVAGLAPAAGADTWRLGGFEIAWRDGFVRTADSGVIRYMNLSDQVGVTVDLLNHGPMTSQEEKAAVEHWREYGRTALVAVAMRHGQVVIPLHEETRKDGAVLISVADEQQRPSGKGFGLFFLLIKPDGRLAQFVVEGPGAAVDRMAQFRPYLDTAHWID